MEQHNTGNKQGIDRLRPASSSAVVATKYELRRDLRHLSARTQLCPTPAVNGRIHITTPHLAGQTDGETTDTPEGQRGGDGYSEICRDHLRNGEQANRPGENRQGSVVDETLALVCL